MTSKKYIPVFVDAKPQENLDFSVVEHRCLVGLLASKMTGLPRLNHYKKTRTKKRKLQAANKIISSLNDETIEVDVIGIVGRTNGQYLHWAIDTINRACEQIGAKWVLKENKPVELRWKDCIFPISNVFGLCVYAGMLPIIALRSIIIVGHANSPVKNINLFLDSLPHNSPQGIALMNALKEEAEIASMWRQNEEQGYQLKFGVLESFVDDFGNKINGKEHPNAILVDWFAASCLAKKNPEQLQIEGGYTDNEVEIIRDIWDAAEIQKRGSANIIDVDDPEFQKNVASHWEKVRDKSKKT